MNMQFTLLMWIDNYWGESVGWGIRISMTVIGAILFFVGMNQEDAQNH